MIARRTLYALGGYLPGVANAASIPATVPAGNIAEFEERVASGLGADQLTILADGVTPATLHFASVAPGPHVWTVNGAAHGEPAEQDAATGLYWSAIEVTRAAPDLVEVGVGGESLTIEAV